jgi:putative ABC transport system permease protein
MVVAPRRSHIKTKTYIKTLFRQIRGSLGRFLAILGIVALGVGFFAGMLAISSDFFASVDAYYDRECTADIFVKATMGLTKKDIEAVSAMEGVESVMPAFVTDALMHTDLEKPIAVRIYGVPLERLKTGSLQADSLEADPLEGDGVQWDSFQGDGLQEDRLQEAGGAFLNRLELVEGRMPSSDNECLAHGTSPLSTGVKLGAVLKVAPEHQSSEDIGDIYQVTEYTVVGIVNNPFYFSWEREPTSVGNGRLDAVIYVNESCYALDVYTDLYITVRDADKLTAFTPEYEARLEEMVGKLEALGEVRSGIRYTDILAEGRAETDKAKGEYEDAKAEVDAELADAWAGIEKGRAELDDARRQIEEGKAGLADAKTKLAEETAKALDEIEQGKRELAEALVELEDAERRLAEAGRELEEGEEEYNKGYNEYRKGRGQLSQAQASFDRAEAEYLEGLSQWKEAGERIKEEEEKLLAAEDELRQAESKYEEGLAAFQEQKAQFDLVVSSVLGALRGLGIEFASGDELFDAMESDPTGQLRATVDQILVGAGIPMQADDLLQISLALDNAKLELDSTYSQIEAGKAACAEGRQQLEQGKAQHASAKAQLDAGKAELERSRAMLEDGWAELAKAKSQLEDARAQLDKGRAELEKGRKELDDGWKEYHEGLARIAEAEIELAEEVTKAEEEIRKGEADLAEAEEEYAEGLRKLREGEAEYWKAKADAEKELADAWQEILDAEESLSDIEEPEWYVFDRKSNVSYSSFSTNIQKVAAIAKVFPGFFFFVAALVALTTMARMVEEERTELGTLKALGYPTWTIISRYVVYSGLSSLFGCIVGSILGFKLLPRIIWQVYKSVYRLPPLITEFRWDLAMLSSVLALSCTIGATVSACWSALKERPASLMRPRPPKAGKRVFLERIPAIWSRLTFSYKATVRNLVRYRRNFVMTVLGVAGCTALLVTGFGLRDSIGDLAQTQFDEITKFDLYIALDSSYEGFHDDSRDSLNPIVMDPILNRFLNDPNVTGYVEAFSETGYVMANGRRVETTVMVPIKSEDLAEVVTLRDRRSGKGIAFSDSSVVLTEKMAVNLGLRPGDVFTLESGDGEVGEFVLSQITEYYAGSYAYIGKNECAQVFGEEPSCNVLMAKTGIAGSKEQDNTLTMLLASDAVLGAQFISQIRESLDTILNSISLIVIVFIVSSGALAAIVLYNLININIAERKRELATLKVLGFHGDEVAAYIFREITILTAIGITLGFGLGLLLHGFVIRTVETPDFMFGRQVSPTSMALSGAFTLAYSFIVQLAMAPRLRKIKMAESMKVVE